LAACSKPTAKPSYSIPFEFNESRVPIISAVLNINPRDSTVHPPAKRLAVDTGAAHSAFFASDSMVADLGKIIAGASLDERMAANGSLVHVCHFPAGRVTVAGLNVDMPVDASARDMTIDPGFDGVLGTDFLSRFNVQFDFAAKKMILTER
jgi:hypothetical protein